MSPGPEHHVLNMPELRRCLGVGPNATGVLPVATGVNESQPMKIILVGHDMHADFDNLREQGIDLIGRLPYAGCVDTNAMVEDFEVDGTRGMSKSLSGLMGMYRFARLHLSTPKRGNGNMVFDGAHNAGNDAIATLMVAVAQALDKRFSKPRAPGSEPETGLSDEWRESPLCGIERNTILLAYDTETVENRFKAHVENRVTEHGLAWLRFGDVAKIPPGEDGKAWHDKIHAAHFINRDWKNFENSLYMCGNSKGFWPRYGKSQIYNPRDGGAPFHAMFQKLTGRQNGRDVVDILGNMSLQGSSSPASFPTVNSRGHVAPRSFGLPDSSIRLSSLSAGRDLASACEAIAKWNPDVKKPLEIIDMTRRAGPSAQGGSSKQGNAPAVEKVGSVTAPVAIRIRGAASSSSSETSWSGGSTPPSSDPESDFGSAVTPAPMPPKISWAQIACEKK